jgi:hypothetical protein
MFGSQFGTELSGTPTEGLVARLCGHPAEACEFLNREAHLRDITGPAAVTTQLYAGLRSISSLMISAMAMTEVVVRVPGL